MDVSVLIRLVDSVTAPARQVVASLKGVQAQTTSMAATSKAATAANVGMAQAWKTSIASSAPLIAASNARIARGVTEIKTAALGAGIAARGMVRSFAKIGALAGVGGLVAGGGAFAITRKYAEATDEITKFSRQIGMQVQTIRELDFVAGRQGVGVAEFHTALEALNRRLGELRLDKGPLVSFLKDDFPDLLASLKQATPEEAFNILIAAMNEIEDPAQRAALAMAAFGRSGVRMTRIAELGADGLKDMRAEARKFLGVIGQESGAEAEKFVDAMGDISSVITGLRDSIGSKLLPAMTPLVEKLRDFIAVNREVIASGFVNTMKGIGSAIASVNWAAVGAGIKGIGSGLATVARWLGGWQNFIAGLVALRFVKPIFGLAKGIGLIATGLAGLGAVGVKASIAALVAGLGPLGIVLAGIAASAALLWANWDKLSPAWNRVSEASTRLLESLKPIGQAINDITKNLTGKNIGELFEGLSESAVSGIASALEAVATALERINKLVAAFKEGGLAGGLKELGSGLGDFAKSDAGFGTFQTRPGSVLDTLTGGRFTEQPSVVPKAADLPKVNPLLKPQSAPGAASSNINSLRQKISDLTGGGQDSLASMAATAPVQGRVPAGFTIEAKGPQVNVKQAPPSIVNHVNVSVSTNADPTQIANQTARIVGHQTQSAMFDGVGEF